MLARKSERARSLDHRGLLKKLRELPLEAQREVLDFVAFLGTRHDRPHPAERSRRIKLSRDPFIGMWQDHQDLLDSRTWVRNLRKREWQEV